MKIFNKLTKAWRNFRWKDKLHKPGVGQCIDCIAYSPKLKACTVLLPGAKKINPENGDVLVEESDIIIENGYYNYDFSKLFFTPISNPKDDCILEGLSISEFNYDKVEKHETQNDYSSNNNSIDDDRLRRGKSLRPERQPNEKIRGTDKNN